MSKVRIVLEAAKSLHPMAVHAYPSEKGKFTVHATGSKVKHVKKGDTVTSSDLDDLSDAGHKVKEVKKPVSEGYQRDSGYGHAADAHYKTLSSKMKDAVNLHLRKGKSYDDAVKAAKVHVKEEEELEEGKMGSGGYRTKDGTYVPFKSYEKAGQEVRAKRAEAGRALADADKKTKDRAKANEEVEQLDELKPAVLARYINRSHKDAMGHKSAQRDYAMLGREASMSRDDKAAAELHSKAAQYKKMADKRSKGIENATKRLAKEEAEQVDEKLTPEAKSGIRQALGPKTPGNEMRKTSKSARTLISIVKSNKKNVAEEDAGSIKQKAIQKYLEQGMSYNDAVKRAEVYLKKKGLM